MSSDGYFASQALRAGLLGGAAMHSLPLPKSDREAIEREIMKKRIRKEILTKEMAERRILVEEVRREIDMAPLNSDREVIGREIMKKQIREEILVREMAERRILEQEVRREIELERIMEIRRFKMESGLAGTSGMVMHGDRPTQTFMPSLLEASGGASVGREFVQDAVEFEFSKRSPSSLLQKKTLAVADSSLRNKSEKRSTSKESTTSNFKSPGANGKAEKLWGCALCELSASSEKTLKEHLQGKKHKANEALLGYNKKIGHLQSKNNATLPLEGASATEPLNKKHPERKKQQKLEGASATEPLNKKHPERKKQQKQEGASATEPLDKKQPERKKQQKLEGATGPLQEEDPEGNKQQKLWCGICKVKCNGPIMMEYHLAGKKHLTLMKLKKAGNSIQTNGSEERSK